MIRIPGYTVRPLTPVSKPLDQWIRNCTGAEKIFAHVSVLICFSTPFASACLLIGLAQARGASEAIQPMPAEARGITVS
jgi:hypothetical protein